jgi:hypothetical protein
MISGTLGLMYPEGADALWQDQKQKKNANVTIK